MTTLRAHDEVGHRSSCARAMSPITPVSPPQGRRSSEGDQWRARGGAGRAIGPAACGPREARARGPEPQGGRRAAARAQAAATQGASHVRTPPSRAHALTHSLSATHVLFTAVSVRCAEHRARDALAAPARAPSRPASHPVYADPGSPTGPFTLPGITSTHIVNVLLSNQFGVREAVNCA